MKFLLSHLASLKDPFFYLQDKYAPTTEKSDLRLKRRWDDDVVFKNCSRAEPDDKKEKTFINDSLRSDFHRKFMDKYVK